MLPTLILVRSVGLGRRKLLLGVTAAAVDSGISVVVVDVTLGKALDLVAYNTLVFGAAVIVDFVVLSIADCLNDF